MLPKSTKSLAKSLVPSISSEMYSLLVLLCLWHFAASSPAPGEAGLQSRGIGYVQTQSLFACPAAAWLDANVGSLIQPQLPDGELQSFLGQISPSNIEATILKLVSFRTRHTLSSQTGPHGGIGAARDWLASQYGA